MKIQLTFLLIVTCFIAFGQSPRVEELGNLYMSGKLDQVINKATEYLKNEPNNVDYKLILGRALTDKDNYTEAIPNLLFAVEKDNSWRKAWALAYVGSCHYMLAEYEKSNAELKSCIELNATKNATNYAYKRFLLFGFDDFFTNWDIVESKNIRFHFQKMSDSEKEFYIKSRENAFIENNQFFDSSLPKKIDFFVWDSREDATKILRANLGFADPGYCIVHSHFQQTKGHELTHVISNYLSPDIVKTGLINEGTSVCFDLTNQNKSELVASWLENHNQKVNIRDIWSNWKNYPNEFSYPLSGEFVRELITTFEKEKFLVFFNDQTYENAKSVFGEEIDILIEEFENKYNG